MKDSMTSMAGGKAGPDPVFIEDNPGEYWIGRVVSECPFPDYGHFGHIAGFHRDAIGRLLLKVSWDTGKEGYECPGSVELH